MSRLNYNLSAPPRVVALRRLGQTDTSSTDPSGGVLQIPPATIQGGSPLDIAAQGLLDDLNARGCQQSKQTTVSNFQSQWNAAGSSPRLAVDGLYGPNTASALTTWATSMDPTASTNGVQAVPAGCVGVAPAGAASPTALPSASAPGGVSSTLASLQANIAAMPWWAYALAGGVGLYAIYESSKHPKGHLQRRLHGHKARRRLRRMRRHARRR